MAVKHIGLSILLVLLSSLLPTYGAFAQGGGQGVRIYAVDTTKFPEMQVDVAVPNGFDNGQFALSEDGVHVSIEGTKTVEKGVQVAIVLDASGSINKPGATKDPNNKQPLVRREEAIKIIDDLVMTDKWIKRTAHLDWGMLVMPHGVDQYSAVQKWTNDYTTIHNAAYQYPYQKQTGNTPLLAMIVSAMSLMKDVPGYEQRAKLVVVISDGVDKASDQEIQDVYIRANSLGVAILSIKLGPKGTGQARNLKRLAGETGGAFTTYTGLSSLTSVYQVIQRERMQNALTYRSNISQSGKHTIQVSVRHDSQELRSHPFEFGISVQPPSVQITQPTDDIVFDARTQEPRTQPVAFQVSWPDNHPRDLSEATYIVDGTVIATLLPDSQFVWEISKLMPGKHSLKIEVKDVLGLTGQSAALSAIVPEILPPSVRIVDPTTGTVYNRKPMHWYEIWFFDKKTLEPRTQLVKIEVSWPDGKPRSIKQISYMVDSHVVSTLPPSESFMWDFSDLEAGVHALQVEAEDSLGLKSKSAEAQINIALPQPPSPLTIFSLALAGLSMLVAAYVLIKRPQVVQDMATKAIGVIREVTEPFIPRRGGKGPRPAAAVLIPIGADGLRGTPIKIIGQTVRLGRDAELAEITFPDRSVSRLHARIVEEADGVFKIYDDGSRSGTYVNYELVPMSGCQLNAGDEIQMGRVQLIFQPRTADETSVTEPFLPVLGPGHSGDANDQDASGRDSNKIDPDMTTPFEE